MECFRKFGIDFMKFCVDDGGDLIFCYFYFELGEICGNIFFLKISFIVDQVVNYLGILFCYFGIFYFNLENGYVWKFEGVFENIELLLDLYKEMVEFLKRMFGIFKGIYDFFYNYLFCYVFNGSNLLFLRLLFVGKNVVFIYFEFVINNE